MKALFVADLHYGLKQFDWLAANAAEFDAVMIGGDLLDLGSSLDLETQIIVVEKYLGRIARHTRLLVSSGNHDGDGRNAAQESICRWLREAKAGQLFVDGDSVVLGETLITICPWWDGPESRAEVDRLLTRDSTKGSQLGLDLPLPAGWLTRQLDRQEIRRRRDPHGMDHPLLPGSGAFRPHPQRSVLCRRRVDRPARRILGAECRSANRSQTVLCDPRFRQDDRPLGFSRGGLDPGPRSRLPRHRAGRERGRCMRDSSTSSTMPMWSWSSYWRFTSIR